MEAVRLGLAKNEFPEPRNEMNEMPCGLYYPHPH